MSTKTRRKKQPAAEPEVDTNGTPPVAAALADAETGNLDKVRTILFGAQSREYDKRFARLEEQYAREMNALKENMRRRFDELEAYVKGEDQALAKRIATEQRQRKEGQSEAASERKAALKSTNERLAELEEQLAESERTLRARQLEQSNALSTEIQQQFDTVSAMIRDAVDTLREEKTDRLALADLLEEVSSRLRGDFELPFE